MAAGSRRMRDVLIKPKDRAALEGLLRYRARPAFASERSEWEGGVELGDAREAGDGTAARTGGNCRVRCSCRCSGRPEVVV